MKKYIFKGKTYIRRDFEIEVTAKDYESAQEQAIDSLSDLEHYSYKIHDENIEIDIEEYEEVAKHSLFK